jgi:hypothetical protein
MSADVPSDGAAAGHDEQHFRADCAVQAIKLVVSGEECFGQRRSTTT